MKATLAQLCFRGIVLFTTGVFFTLILSLLQIQRNLPLLKLPITFSVLYSPWWVPAISGTASAIVGLLYPCLDQKLGEHQFYEQEWSNVIRCVGVFIGINHAIAKINFTSNLQLSLSLTVLSIGLWWWFDRTTSGLGLGVSIAVIATFITQMLVYHGVCNYTEHDFLYIRAWLPCVLFCGGITVGNIGRQLAVDDFIDSERKRHRE
ncbi:insulin-induced gene 2 protein-like [Limulus polyphemus]|uniref:Insulin-induced gene 2 protein-like n=1 Tax=Limulus polyphemus TaxID=6850 RepID=A0ABM1STY5_LIMPO|nr:insulin-induced gene 2 protein-like [Limulus polyphemus]XP_022247091.1 insulin-induced gene 2 protein-like [Limulus polyphemus]